MPQGPETEKRHESGRSRKRISLLEKLTASEEPDRKAISSYINIAGQQWRAILMALGLLAVIAVLAFAAIKWSRNNGGKAATASAVSTASEAETAPLTEEELKELERQNTIDNELSAYTDLAIVDVSGYINVRSQPDVLDMTNIIGQLQDGAACSIISQEGDWYLVESGGIRGYASAQYFITGEDAVNQAKNDFADRAIIETEVLNIRSAPTVDAENVIGKARVGERYEVLELQDDEWARIKADFSEDYEEAYIFTGDGNAVIRYCLNEARRLDLREMALTQFDQLVVAATDGYINIRETPEDEGISNIVGQFPEHAGGELLETVEADGRTWYKIRSRGVTGYVSAEYCVTGNEARNIAVDAAQLTAYITTDALNVRSEPSLEATAWTQVTRDQSYHVLDQLDGWVEIELDGTDDEEGSDRAFISTRDNNVEVTYGLPVAIEYYPALEAENAQMAFRNSIVNYAVQFVGNPYVWGGTSLTNGADCSGFVQSVLRHFGISVPRVSRDQARSGNRITSDQMRPGDLVFYANSSGTINHVAMYIGNGQVVNAASRRSGITIYRWNYRTPVAIRDVIGDRTG
ncbi:MAG TPA: SH3 domain-containing protein [Candidatus Avilachnospira avicola]|nr:SH3 domain-containing protein [Candidatus Avilachnospira avicola]